MGTLLSGVMVLLLSFPASAAWVCSACEWVDPIEDYVIVGSDGVTTEHSELDAGITYSQPLGDNARWGKVTLTTEGLTVKNQQLFYRMVVSDYPGSRHPYRGQPRCADEWAQTVSLFVLRSYVYAGPDWYCIIDEGKPFFVNFWPTLPGGDDCGGEKPCAVRIIDGLSQDP